MTWTEGVSLIWTEGEEVSTLATLTSLWLVDLSETFAESESNLGLALPAAVRIL